MDMDLAAVVTAVSKNKSIKHLHMGRNMANMKAKHISAVMEALVTMIQVLCCALLPTTVQSPGIITGSRITRIRQHLV